MALAAPLNVHWELTNVCNLRCVHCYQRDDGPRRGLPPDDTLRAIAENIVSCGVFEVTLTGGEVMLVPGLRDLIAYFNAHGIRPHLTSNGMLVDERAADWLAELDLSFQVSIDAADPGRHNEIRRSPRAFDQALAGVGRLVERGVDVSFAYTALPANLAEIQQVVHLAAREGVARVCVGEVLPEYGGEANRRRLRLDQRSFGLFVTELSRVREQYRDRVDVAIALLSGHLHDPGLHDSPCTAAARDVAILHDGWAYPCPFVRDRSRRLGDARHVRLADIWAAKAAQGFREERDRKARQGAKPCVSEESGPVVLSLLPTRLLDWPTASPISHSPEAS